MKFFTILLGVVFGLAPTFALAANGCSSDGYTVVYINGMNTTKDSATVSMERLSENFENLNKGFSKTPFLLGYNSSLGTLTDTFQSFSQLSDETLGGSLLVDGDLKSILSSIHNNLHTHRVLLVGYSQGAFYANEVYRYLTNHGVSPYSVGVYLIGAPTSYVGGVYNGYVTSANDQIIAALRNHATNQPSLFNNHTPLPSNIAIDPVVDYEDGHAFSEVYLTNAALRIVADMDSILSKLSNDIAVSGVGACFTFDENDNIWSGADSAAQGQAVAAGVGVAVAAGSTGISNTANGVVTFLDAITLGIVSGTYKLIVGHINGTLNEQTDAQNTRRLVQGMYGTNVPDDIGDLLVGTAYEGLSKKTGGAVALAFSGNQEKVIPATVPVTLVPVATTTLDTLLAATSTATTTLARSATTTKESAPVSSADSISSTLARLAAEAAASGDTENTDDPAPDEEASTTPEVASTTPAVLFTATTTAPELSVPDCADSLAYTQCLLASASTTVSWSKLAGAVSYQLTINGVATTTTATSTLAMLAENATTTLQVTAFDASSTPLVSNTVEVLQATHPLIINEIGWGGTTSYVEDQWIELKRTVPYALDLSKFVLAVTEGGSQYIPLSAARIRDVGGNFITAESARSGAQWGNEYPIISIGANEAFIYNSSLEANAELLPVSGAQLTVQVSGVSGTTTVDRTPSIATCSGWCAGSINTPQGESFNVGSSPSYPVSMARLHNTEALGAESGSWMPDQRYTRSGGIGDRGRVANESIFATPLVDNGEPLEDFMVGCINNNDGITRYATNGASFAPGDSACGTFSRFITIYSPHVTAVFHGAVGSSTIAYGPRSVLGSVNMPAQYLSFSDFVPGDVYTVAVWEGISTGVYPNSGRLNNSFVHWFETGHPLSYDTDQAGTENTESVAPPHSNYRSLSFTFAQ